MDKRLTVHEHPHLALGAFETTFEAPLASCPSPAWLVDLLVRDADAAVSRSEEIRKNIRDMLRHGGYKPTGRGKPASEYLVRSAEQGKLGSINLAVDANNAVSLHSGLPISVLDLDRVVLPLRVGIAEKVESYVFNSAGQEIDVSGLLCVFDAQGPCGNAVKDSQRSKTSEVTTRTLSLVWGSQLHKEQLEDSLQWYRDLLHRAGAATESWTWQSAEDSPMLETPDNTP